jgi:hypothetical protein
MKKIKLQTAIKGGIVGVLIVALLKTFFRLTQKLLPVSGVPQSRRMESYSIMHQES